MKILSLAILLALLASLKIGYYTSYEIHGPIETIFFIKKAPTLKIKFINLFAKSGDHPRFNYLRDDQRRHIIDYCKYRLGIETELQSEEEMMQCSAY